MTSNRLIPTFCCNVYRLGLVLLLLAPALSWATLNPDNGYLLDFESAVAEFDAKDYAAADIHLKNALKKTPNHLPSRLLLGRTALKLGRAPEAEKELLIALRGGAAKDRVVIPLGNALLLQRKYRDILEKITIEGIANSGRYEVLTLRGRAQQELGELENAHHSFDQAIAYNDKSMEAYLGKSRTFSATGDYTNADIWIGLALDREPTSNELLFEKANLRRRQGENTQAMALYNKVLSSSPGHMRARLARASLSLSLGDLEQAKTDSEYVHKRVPKDPDAALIYAQALGRSGKREEAKKVLQAASDILSRIDEKEILAQPGLLRIAALISLQQGVVNKALFYLERYVELVPHELQMRMILARVKLQIKDTDGAVRVLEPAYKNGTQDAELFGLIGEAYLEQGRFNEAQTALEKAAQLAPELPQVNTRLALSKIGGGEGDEAWQDLSTAHSTSAEKSATAGIVMAIMLVRAAKYEQGLTLSKELLEKQPGNPILHNLMGIVRLGRNELGEAKTAFEKALEADPNFIPAMYNLGLIELQAKNLDAAEVWFKRILQLKPQQSKALIALAEINVAQGNNQEAIALLEKATISKSDDIAPHRRLIEILLQMGDFQEAQRQGATLIGRYPESAQIMELLGQVEIAAGNREKAIGYLRNASQLANSDGVMLIRIADQLLALGDYQTARIPLVLALTTDQKMLAKDRLVKLYLRQGDVKNARIQAAHVRKEQPDAALGYVLEARILQSESAYEQAILQYQKAVDKQDNRDAIVELYTLYDRLGRQQDGFQLLEEWIKNHPTDSISQRILALGYLKADRRDDAQVMLEELARTRPNDSLVLATLAQLYLQEGNPGARVLAERALKAAPNWSVAMDTYGWILVQAGAADEALNYLREALTRDSNPLIRYHLAAALHDLGRDSEALAELEIIMGLSPEPPWIGTARELYDAIKKSG